MPYIQNTADGLENLEASMICLPTFTTSTTPISTTSDVVLIILVSRFIMDGISLRIVCGMMIWKNTCRCRMPSA